MCLGKKQNHGKSTQLMARVFSCSASSPMVKQKSSYHHLTTIIFIHGSLRFCDDCLELYSRVSQFLWEWANPLLLVRVSPVKYSHYPINDLILPILKPYINHIYITILSHSHPIFIWGCPMFPEIGVPPNHPFPWHFPWNKPSSYWDTPHTGPPPLPPSGGNGRSPAHSTGAQAAPQARTEERRAAGARGIKKPWEKPWEKP